MNNYFTRVNLSRELVTMFVMLFFFIKQKYVAKVNNRIHSPQPPLVFVTNKSFSMRYLITRAQPNLFS